MNVCSFQVPSCCGPWVSLFSIFYWYILFLLLLYFSRVFSRDLFGFTLFCFRGSILSRLVLNFFCGSLDIWVEEFLCFKVWIISCRVGFYLCLGVTFYRRFSRIVLNLFLWFEVLIWILRFLFETVLALVWVRYTLGEPCLLYFITLLRHSHLLILLVDICFLHVGKGIDLFVVWFLSAQI